MRLVGCVHAIAHDIRVVVIDHHVVQPHQPLANAIQLTSLFSSARTTHEPVRLVIRHHRTPQRRNVRAVAVIADLFDIAAPSYRTALFSLATVIAAAVRVDLLLVWIGC